MKILITGGAGFVGKNLIRVMKEEGFNPADITVIDKDEVNLNFVKNLGANTVLADLAAPGRWSDNFYNQDLIITLHAQISGPQYDLFRKNNIDATQNVIEAAKKFGIKKIIHFSSAAVLSVRQDFYATTKKAAEKLVKNSRLSYVILQPSLMYGPLDDKNIGWLINFAKKCPIFPIPGNGQYPRQPIYIDDISHLVIKMIHNFPSTDKTYSINGQQIINFREIISVVLKNMGGLRLTIYLPLPIFLFLLKIYDIIFHSPFTPDQIKSLTSGDVFPEYPWWQEFNIKMTPFDQGVKNMLEE